MHPDDSINNLNRLRWACRRGMLELDVLLSNFLNEAYSHLETKDKQLFCDLLQSPDPELFAWLMGNEDPNEAGLLKIIGIMRHHAKARFQI